MSNEASDTEPKIPNSIPKEGSSPEAEAPTPSSPPPQPPPPPPPPPTTEPSARRERRERPLRACTTRSTPRFNPASPPPPRKPSTVQKDKLEQQEQTPPQCTKIITPLLDPPSQAQLPRWNLRSMWELASVLNFFNVFRPLLNISVEFTAEELESALITPNNTLDDIHIPLLKAIPPIIRMAMGRGTWVTVLCRKLRDWWHWVAEGELPIVASQGGEIEVYKSLDPGVRVLILKALCDIRVEQEDIRSYIDGNLKHGVHISLFRKERIGGDSHGVSYWFEDDPIVGHRLYREIRKIEVKKVKTRGIPSTPIVSCQWETVATNLEEFEDVSEKLFSSKSRIEVAVGKKLKNDMLPEIEKIQKKKEKLLKKQHRQALLLDSYLHTDGITSGRSLRDRKPVTYTFDDYDRSITEAIKITKKKQPSPEPAVKREIVTKPEASSNGRLNGRSYHTRHVSYDELSPKSTDSDETEEEEEDDEDNKSGPLDRSDRRRQRPQRYSEKEFVEAVSDYEAEFESDDEIVGEAIYDEEYMRSRKQRRISSSSEGEDEQSWEEENLEDEEEEEEEDEYMSSSEDSDEPHRSRKLPSRSRRRGTKLRSVDELQSGLRRSRRASRNRIDYRQYEFSESESESTKPEKLNASGERSDASNGMEYSAGSQDSQVDEIDQKMMVDQPTQEYNMVDVGPRQSPEKTSIPAKETNNVGPLHFLDLNELAPGSGFDDVPSMIMKDDARNNF